MSSTKILITADELLLMPKDGFKYELVEGELNKMSPSGYKHGITIARLAGRLQVYIEENNLGEVCGAETGFIISSNPDTVIAPDIAFISNQRILQITNPDTYSPIAPELVVEVLSPSDTPKKVTKKIELWLNFGVNVVILIDPRKKELKVYRSLSEPTPLTEKDTLTLDDILPGFSYSLANLFR